MQRYYILRFDERSTPYELESRDVHMGLLRIETICDAFALFPGSAPKCFTRSLPANSACAVGQIAFTSSPRSKPYPEGRFAIVTNVGRGMRWTCQCDQTKRADADGEVVWA